MGSLLRSSRQIALIQCFPAGYTAYQFRSPPTITPRPATRCPRRFAPRLAAGTPSAALDLPLYPLFSSCSIITPHLATRCPRLPASGGRHPPGKPLTRRQSRCRVAAEAGVSSSAGAAGASLPGPCDAKAVTLFPSWGEGWHIARLHHLQHKWHLVELIWKGRKSDSRTAKATHLAELIWKGRHSAGARKAPMA